MSGETAPRKSFRGPFWIKLVLILVVLCVLFDIYPDPSSIRSAQALQLLVNGKQVWAAARLEDRMHAAYPATMPVTTAREYVAALVHSGEIKEADLRLLAGPHHLPAAKTVTDLSETNIAFTVYRIGPNDSPETVFLVSKPDVFKDRRVEIHKDGSAQVCRLAQSPTIVSPLPKATPPTLLP